MKITIHDYGKDYGFGRYNLEIDDGRPDHEIKKVGTNYASEIMLAVLYAIIGKEAKT